MLMLLVRSRTLFFFQHRLHVSMLLLIDALLFLQTVLERLRAPHYHYSSSSSSSITACMLAQSHALNMTFKTYFWGYPRFLLFRFLKKAEERSGVGDVHCLT